MANAPARVDISDIANFLAETQGLTPEEQAHYRQEYFNKYVLQHWNTFDEKQRMGIQQAFNLGLDAPLKMPDISAEAAYRRDVMARGGNPNDPKQSGGGTVGLGSTAQSVGDEFMRGGFGSGLWEAGPFGPSSSAADPIGYLGGAARGAFAAARLPATTGWREMGKMLMNPNPVMQRSTMQAIKDMGIKGAEWGSAGMIPLATAIGRGLWRRLPFGQGAGGAMPRPGGIPGGAGEMPMPGAGAAAEAGGAMPRPRVRYGPDESGSPQITLPY